MNLRLACLKPIDSDGGVDVKASKPANVSSSSPRAPKWPDQKAGELWRHWDSEMLTDLYFVVVTLVAVRVWDLIIVSIVMSDDLDGGIVFRCY